MRATRTVRIVDPRDPTSFRIIDEKDFDPARHRLWERRAVPPARPERTPVQPSRRHR